MFGFFKRKALKKRAFNLYKELVFGRLYEGNRFGRQYLTNELGMTFDQRNSLVVGIAMGFYTLVPSALWEMHIDVRPLPSGPLFISRCYMLDYM